MPSRAIYRKVLRIKEMEFQTIQRIIDMDRETFKLSGISSSKILRIYNIEFEDEYKVNISIHGGAIIGEKYRPGYVLCSLINRNDNKVGEDIISSTIEGQYKFYNNEKIYMLDIIVE